MDPIKFANILKEAADKITALKGYPSIVTTKAPPEFRYFQRGHTKYKVETADPSSYIQNQRNSRGKWEESIMTLNDMLGNWGNSLKPIEYFPSKGENEPASKPEEMQATDSNPSKPIPAPALPASPEDCHPVIMGPLAVSPTRDQEADVASYSKVDGWDFGYIGNAHFPYALRKGSQIARLNGLEFTLEVGRTYATNAGEIISCNMQTTKDNFYHFGLNGKPRIWNLIGQALINGVAQPIYHPDSIQEEIPVELLPLPVLPDGFKEWLWRGKAWGARGITYAFKSENDHNWTLSGIGCNATKQKNFYYLEAIPAYKEPAKARREWDASVCRANGGFFQRYDNDDPERWKYVNVREILPGDPTQDDINKLVSAAASIVASATDTRWLEAALQPFTGKKSS